MRGYSTLGTLSCEVLRYQELMVPHAVMEPFSLTTKGMVGFRKSRGQEADRNHQRQGELSYYNVWQGWNSSWMVSSLEDATNEMGCM